MKWILILIGVGIVAWFLKPRGGKKNSDRASSPVSFPELAGLPPCTLDIDNGSEIQEGIMRSVKRGIGEGLAPAMCADRIAKILKKEKLNWPSFDNWSAFVRAHPERFGSFRISETFSNEAYFQPTEVEAYAGTVYGYLVIAEKIERMKDAGFKNVFWSCRPQDACCDVCAALDGRKMPIDTFMDMCLVHPCCNGMPGVDQSC
jgi:hypothetical protein